MIAPQTPPLPVFIPIQAVAGADVPSQRLPPVAAIETNHAGKPRLGPMSSAVLRRVPNRVRRRLFAGGDWIRTSSTRAR